MILEYFKNIISKNYSIAGIILTVLDFIAKLFKYDISTLNIPQEAIYIIILILFIISTYLVWKDEKNKNLEIEEKFQNPVDYEVTAKIYPLDEQIEKSINRIEESIKDSEKELDEISISKTNIMNSQAISPELQATIKSIASMQDRMASAFNPNTDIRPYEERLTSYKYSLKSYINEMKTYLEQMKVFYKEREGKMYCVFFNIHNIGTIFDEHLDTEIRSKHSLFSENIYSDNSPNHPKRPDKQERSISFEQNLFDPMKHIRDIPHVDILDSNPQTLRRYLEIKYNSISLIFRDLKADEDAKLLKRAVFIKSNDLNDLEFEIKSKMSNKRIVKEVKLDFKERITRDEAIQMFRA